MKWSGGTFTISNGGVFGSLLSTPIINPPQSAVLGMHRIEERPVVKDGAIVARPMMYLALSYDHRIIDGREAVTFLVRVKEAIEDPTRLLYRPLAIPTCRSRAEPVRSPRLSLQSCEGEETKIGPSTSSRAIPECWNGF